MGISDFKSVETQAADWLAKLDSDDPSNEDLQAFKRWIQKDEAHYQAFEGMIDFWDDLNVLTQVISPREKSQQHCVANSDLSPRWFRRGFAISGLVAFAVAVAFVVVVPLFQATAPVVYMTKIGEQKVIELPDHTTVLLNTNSRLEVNYSQHSRRVVLTRGEAYFDVFHNPELPFEVYAGERLVRAVGTAFTVHVRKVNVEVVVTEGVVEIGTQEPVTTDVTILEGDTSSSGDEALRSVLDRRIIPKAFGDGVQVKAGSSAVYDSQTLDQVKLLIAETMEEKLSWRQGLLIFKGEPLEKVVAEVSRYTPLEIIIPERKARELKVGGLFKVGDTESLFEALNESFNIHAKYISDNQVYLIFNENR